MSTLLADRMLTFRGKTQSLWQWGREFRVDYRTIAARLRLGWSVRRALTAPVDRARNTRITKSRRGRHAYQRLVVSVSDQTRDIARMFDEGASYAKIMKTFGVSKTHVDRSVRAVRDAEGRKEGGA